MSPSRRATAAGLVVCALLLTDCRLISLETLVVTTYPSTHNQIIDAGEAIRVAYSVPLDHLEAESSLEIQTPDGGADGDMNWDGDAMTFTAVPPLPVGERLVLTLSGSVRAADGRVFSVDHVVVFFVGTDAERPGLADQSPEDGATVDVRNPIVLTFSRAMDAAELERSFSLNPTTEYRTNWDATHTEATILPVDRWEPLTFYRWQVAGSALAEDGSTLGRDYTGTFLTQADEQAPMVTLLEPAVLLGGLFVPVPGTLDDLRTTDSILIELSEDVDPASLTGAWSLDPAVSGHFVRLEAGRFVYATEERFEPGVTYHLEITTDLQDLSGNRMAQPYHSWFVPDIPRQRVLSITPFSDPPMAPVTVFNSATPTDPVTLPAVPGDELRFTIIFDQPYDDEHKSAVSTRILCEAFFPATILDPSLVGVLWASDTEVTLTFVDFVPSAPPILHYYRLLAPAGQLANQDGSELREDVWIVFVAR